MLATIQNQNKFQSFPFASYSNDVFMELNSFEVSAEKIKEYKPLILELGKIICSHNLQDIVGISLLHKHFDLHSNELLLKDYINNKSLTQPSLMENDQNAVPYMWKLHWNSVSGDFSFFPLEFMRPSEKSHIAKIQSDTVLNSNDFLFDFANKILDLELTELFGIATLHDDSMLDVKKNEFLSESTDFENRILTIQPLSSTDHNMNRSTETLWRFTISEDLKADPKLSCDILCTGVGIAAARHCTCGSHV